MLENLHFHTGEEANDPDFAMKIVRSTGARYFIQDGFSLIHQARASTDAITVFVPGVAGFLVGREYGVILNATELPGIKSLLDA